MRYVNLSRMSLHTTAALLAAMALQSVAPFAGAQNFNGSQPGTMVGPSSGWAPTSPVNGSTMVSPGVAGFGYGFGGYRYTPAGGYLNPYGQPVTFAPLVPYVWGGAAPVALGGAAFNCRIGNVNFRYWRAGSGFYYPYLNGANYYAPILFTSSNTQPEAKLPAPAIQLSDLNKFLDDSLKDKKLAEAHYKHLKQRTLDLQRKEKSLRIAQGGELDSESEAEIRRDMEGLTKEMTQRVTL